MLVDVKAKVAMEVEIDAEDAFRILCKSLAIKSEMTNTGRTGYMYPKMDSTTNLTAGGIYLLLSAMWLLICSLICISVMKNTYGMIVRRDEDERDLQKL